MPINISARSYVRDIKCSLQTGPKITSTPCIQAPNTFENKYFIPFNLKNSQQYFQPQIGRKIRIFSLGQKKKQNFVRVYYISII